MKSETIRRVLGEPIDPGPPAGPLTWWDRYRASIAKDGLTGTAMRVADLDSEYLLEHCVFGAGPPGEKDANWPSTRLRRGLVMGSVQSGKTASLLAITAKALDHGIDVVVILAGTRIALWRQTYERVTLQLDGWTATTDSERRLQRVMLPSPALVGSQLGLPGLEDLYFETPNMVRRMLIEKRPVVAVVMKNPDHLLRFGRYLHEVLADTFDRSGHSVHMLVIDDEADDGSILDKDVEGGLAPDSDSLKQIPRHIARLWAGQRPPHETAYEKLFATYIAYTATPQANFLQSSHNPLSPSDFLAALRPPLDEGPIEPPRGPTFAEPHGLRKYYTGGEMFYRRVTEGDGALCVVRPNPQRADFGSADDFAAALLTAQSELLSEALRAYFVGGAIRLLTSKRSLAASRAAGPDSEEKIRQISPTPHSMLYHPSARIDQQFEAAEEVAAWTAKFASGNPGEGISRDPSEISQLNVDGLIARLDAEEPEWKRWLESFEHTREQLSFLPSGQVFPVVDLSQWADIRRLLIEEVFPHTRLAVINSDPRSDDRPRFQPEPVGDGTYHAPRDIFTISVSGNVMARGLTLEGLTTTLFLRSANEPLADTQMQMQRWFGYRGSYLCWCRAFMFDDQANLFRSYHEDDEALRREIIAEMNTAPGRAPSPLVLQGFAFRATGKIANLRALPLCPGPDPFVRVIETGQFAQHNIDALASMLDENSWNDLVVSGTLRGVAMDRQLSLIEVAELLESFRYSRHDPSPSGRNHDRWRALASEIGLSSPEAPLFRPPNIQSLSAEAVAPQDCPYSIAAYLRLWHSLLTRRARGIYPTDDRRTPWSMIDLKEYARSAPRFFVGIRYGSAGLSKEPRLAVHKVCLMKRSSLGELLQSTWGSRNPGEAEGAYLGDQLFDYHIHGGIPPIPVTGEPLWRRRGSPGLVLFHVISRPEGSDVVTVGLALPAGGPDHIAALRQGIGG